MNSNNLLLGVSVGALLAIGPAQAVTNPQFKVNLGPAYTGNYYNFPGGYGANLMLGFNPVDGSYSPLLFDSSGNLMVTSSGGGGSTVSQGPGNIANPWYVQFPSAQAVTGTFWQATQPVSASSLPLPSGAATAAAQTNVQAAAGSNAGTAVGVQGVTGGLAIPVTAAFPDVLSTGNTLNSATANAAYSVSGAPGKGVVGFSVTGLTASGATLTVEASDDGGITWAAVNGVAPNNGTLFATLTTDQQFRVNAAGRTLIRLRVSATGSGTITIASNISSSNGLMALSSPLPAGTNSIGSVIQSGNWSVRLGGSAGAALDAVFGAGTAPTNGIGVLGLYSSSTPTLTTGQSYPLSEDASGRLIVAPHNVTLSANTAAYSATTTATVATSSGTLFTAGQFTQFLQVCTPSAATVPVYLNVSGGAAVVGAGVPVNPGGACTDFGGQGLPVPTAAITGISSIATTLAVAGK